MSVLKTELQNQVLYVWLQRPEVKNCLSIDLIRQIRQCFEGLDASVRVVVLRGSEKFFCAGGDLNWMKSAQTKAPQENESDALELAKMVRAVDECPVPVMSLVEGGAFGGGVGLVAASDIVLAEETALFALSEVKLGLIPATIGPLVMRKVGVSEARRLYLTGQRFSALEAQRIHLVHEVTPADGKSLEASLEKYLKELSSSGPQAARTAKSLIRELQRGDLWKDDVSEETSKILSKIRVQDEAKEGIAAFLEKRKPQWSSKLNRL